MKREKITFAFFLIPILLFPGSLQRFSFDRGKNPNPSLTQKQIKSINESLPFNSKKGHSVKDQVPVNSRPALPEKPKEAARPTYQSRKTIRIPLARFRDFLFTRGRKPALSRFLPQVKYLKKDKPFRSTGPLYRPDQVLVKFRPSFSEQMREATIEAYQSKKLKRIQKLSIYQIQIPENVTVEEMLYLLRQNPDVEYAQPNYLVHISVTPNDTLFKYQYALYNIGQDITQPPGAPQGEEGADIKATAAWEETKGHESVIIAVIDTGVDLDHPDIKNKIYSSGRDFVNDDFDATDDDQEYGHGTHVAGIAAAETNNSDGVAGVAWSCKILPVKVLDDTGEGDYFWLAYGIIWAADNGADVINMSLGGGTPDSVSDEALKSALEYAYEKNIVIIAAAGNDGGAVCYPAAYDDYCLAVAATDYNDQRPDWSNYGPQVDVAAPGDLIFSLFPEDFTPQIYLPYAWESGTSQAAPHVAGLAALIKSIKPWLSNEEIMNIIRYSADDVNYTSNPGKDDYIGYGRINMKKALVPIVIKSSR
jgi:subtilisin family serine protease